MSNYRLSEVAKEDLLRIFEFGVHTFGLEQAEHYFFGFFDCFDRIAKPPFSFETVEYIKQGYRRCVYGSDHIYFRINEGFIEIMCILGKQDFDKI